MKETNSQGFTVDDLFTKSSYTFRKILPFYSVAYICMDRASSKEIKTIGVTEDSLIYNSEFILSKKIEELNFLNLHEIVHVALRHVLRGKGKDRKLWNIACDLYTNSFIESELNDVAEKNLLRERMNGPGSFIRLDSNNIIEMPLDALYCNSIDLKTDTVENIYNSLYEQGHKNGYNDFKNNLDTQNNSFHFEYIGTADGEKFEIDINASQIDLDLVDNGNSREISEQLSDMISNRIKTKNILDKQSGLNITDSKLELEFNELLKSELNWKRYVQKYCIKLISTDTSFRNPDKRMYYQKAIYPGQSINDTNIINGIKVCIDTSGSISEDDFMYFMGQVKSLLDKYKVEAEVIYWDDSVNATGSFKNFKELRNICPTGRGSTDVSVVFNYLNSKECKVKPVLTIIFTDGFFSNKYNTKLNRTKFKDTLWVMTRDHNKRFKPSFGVIAFPKFEEQ